MGVLWGNEQSHPAVDCNIMPTQILCHPKMTQDNIEGAQEFMFPPNWDKFWKLEQKIELKCIVVKEKPDFNAFEYTI